jgi:sortase A
MSDKMFFEKHFLRHKSKIEKIFIFASLFILIFAISFTLINWNLVKYNFEYRVLGTDNEIQENTLNQLQLDQDAYIEGPDKVIIKKIGVEAPLVFANSFDEKDVQNLLKEGLVHHFQTANPGEIGNSVIVGHSSSYQWDKNSYGKVFALLNELEKGDLIFIIHDHKKYRYVVYDKFIVNPDQVEVLSQEAFQTPTVTLLSCWPIGTYWKRIIVRAELKQ